MSIAIEISVSYTNRKPREKEIPDKDYYFVEVNEFEKLIKNQEFLEYAKVFDNFYLLSEVITAQEAIGSVPNLGWFPLGSFSKITMAFSIHKKYKVVQKKSGK